MKNSKNMIFFFLPHEKARRPQIDNATCPLMQPHPVLPLLVPLLLVLPLQVPVSQVQYPMRMLCSQKRCSYYQKDQFVHLQLATSLLFRKWRNLFLTHLGSHIGKSVLKSVGTKSTHFLRWMKWKRPLKHSVTESHLPIKNVSSEHLFSFNDSNVII